MNLASRLLALLLVAFAAAPAFAGGIFQARITVTLPTVLPPLVAVEPGVQVVEDLDDEVFFVDGWYWVRRDARWYRARDWRRTWVYVEPRFVPRGLHRIPPGQYRRFRHAEWKRMKEEERERRRRFREEERERRHAEKEAAKQWQKEKHGRHGHGHDDD